MAAVKTIPLGSTVGKHETGAIRFKLCGAEEVQVRVCARVDCAIHFYLAQNDDASLLDLPCDPARDCGWWSVLTRPGDLRFCRTPMGFKLKK